MTASKVSDMTPEKQEPTPRAKRRMAITIVAIAVLGVAGRSAVLLWGQWLALPTLLGCLAIVLGEIFFEARDQRKTVRALLKEVIRQRGK
jgi:fatty acid desaturase